MVTAFLRLQALGKQPGTTCHVAHCWVRCWVHACMRWTQEAIELRERFFGEELELQPYGAAYGKIWEGDAVNAHHKPGMEQACRRLPTQQQQQCACMWWAESLTALRLIMHSAAGSCREAACEVFIKNAFISFRDCFQAAMGRASRW